ncbi:MAG: hypothetical protein A2102_04410 [Tenericutes bacterium GWF2_38_8]|nr:MAG: hypothetical protein A2102_04410 [Tenericutes bacterium GWF2_38_8]
MFFEIAGGALGLGLILYVVISTIHKKKSEELKSEVIEKLKTYGKITEEQKKLYFETEKEKYQLLFFYAPSSSELTINSKKMWEIRDASGSRLFDQTSFLSSTYEKLVIVYPLTTKIKRYINENEMVFVKPKDHFYEMRVIRHFELDELFKENAL